MTAPYTGFEAQWGSNSPLARQEWDDFNKRHKELVEAIMGTAMDPNIQQMLGHQPVQPAPVMNFDSPFGPPRPAAQDELIAQARFWGIANPEQMDPHELQLRIQQMRAEMPRDQQTSAGSAAMAAFGLASEAGGATSRVVGNVFGMINEVPFVGPTLAQILGTEKAKHWMYDLSQKTSEFAEAARAAQPLQDKGAYEVLAGSGKVAGYALPAMMLWNALGASGAWVPPVWAGRVSSPFIRAAVRGGLSGGIMEVGSDEPTSSKVFSIGIGFAMGGASALPYVGSSIGLGVVGAGIGAQVGDTPEERRRHSIQGGIAGLAIGLSPIFLGAAAKIRQDIPGPFDEAVNTAVKARPTGEDPQRMAQQATARVSQQALPGGPDYEFHPTQGGPQTPQDIIQVRAEPPLEAPQPVESLQAPQQPRGLLMPPRTSASTEMAAGQADALRYEINDYKYWADQNRITRYASPEEITAEGLKSDITQNKLLGDYYRSVTDRTNWRPNLPEIPSALKNTKVLNDVGQPAIVYHGTPLDFESFDLSKADPEALFGPGLYHTENPDVASGYAGLGPANGDYIPGASVKPARLNIQNPFNLEQKMDAHAVRNLAYALEEVAPGYDWQSHVESLVSWINSEGPQPAQGVYQSLATVLAQEPVQGPSYGPPHFASPAWTAIDTGTSRALGKGGLNAALEKIGYDGLTHNGGSITGGVSHRVWIAFRPDQVHSPWDTPPMDLTAAAASGDALTKQATIMESSSLPQAMGRTKMTDADVVDAIYGTNPAGISVIRSINPNWRRTGPGSVGYGDNFRLVQSPFDPKGETFDALVGSPRDLTNEVVRDYYAHGVFKGQRVVTGAGIEAEITGFTDTGRIALRRADGKGPPLMSRPEKLLPSRFGGPVQEAPKLYESFKLDLLNYMNEEAMKAQMAPVAGVWDPRVADVMQARSSDFMDRMGIYDPGARQALDDHFNNSWVEELRTLDPEMKALQESAVHDAYTAHNMAEEDDLHNLPVSMEEKAQSRGFIWLTQHGDGGVLKDTVNPGTPDIPMATDEAANEFLARTDRALPDYTPASDMPADLAMMLPNDINTEHQLPTEHLGDSLAGSIDQAFSETFNIDQGGGAGGQPPTPPPPPPSGGMNELPPGPQETLGGQFDKLRRADPMKLHQMIYDFQGLLSNKIRYMRYGMLNLETKLAEAGVDLGRAHKHYEELDTARSMAYNEATPWIHEWGQIMHGFPKRILRDGTVARLHGIEDSNAKYAAFYRLGQSHGLNDRQITNAIAADGRITDFMQRFFTSWTGDASSGDSAHSELFRYMSGARSKQAQQSPDPYDVESLSPGVRFFGEMAKDSNMQFSIVDARELGLRMIRGAMFKKYEEGPYRQLMDTWSDPRIPEGMKNYMTDWARLVRVGYDPSGEVATRGIQSIMKRVFRTPLTAREAQHLLNMPTGAMYMSMLGGRMSIFFRDAIQPFLALAKVRMPYMAGTYGRVMKGAGQHLTKAEANDFREMYQRGLAGGWIERENPNIEAASIYEEPGGVRTNELLAISPAEAAHRETLARLADPLWGLPNWLVRPRESNLSTLKWYGRQGQLHRLITGESAYQQATAELSAYRRSTMEALISRDPTREQSYDNLAERAFFSSFEPPIQRRLKELVDAGDDEGAARFFAREVSNWSQFRYGRREVPPILRNNVGRALFMFGNFTGQFLEGMASALGNGTPMHKARYLMTVGTVSALMYELAHATGWKGFKKWAWLPYAFQYTGGPLLEKSATAISALTGASNAAYGIAPSETETSAMKDEIRGGMGPNPADFFPYTGYARSAAEYGAAAQGTNPVEQMLRYTITGDRGSRIDIQREIEAVGRQQGHLPEGTLSPNGGLMPGHQQDYHNPRGGYQFPHGTTHPGAGAQ